MGVSDGAVGACESHPIIDRQMTSEMVRIGVRWPHSVFLRPCQSGVRNWASRSVSGEVKDRCLACENQCSRVYLMRGGRDGHQLQRMERFEREQKTGIHKFLRLQIVEMTSLQSSNATEHCVYDYADAGRPQSRNAADGLPILDCARAHWGATGTER